MSAATDKYEMTIGIECHVQLATKTKLFSPSDNDARDASPNSKIHPIDFGLPGMLPVLNYQAIELAAKAGKALQSKIANLSRFDRKHYFYPDLPKGYQTTQMYEPIILGGTVETALPDGTSTSVRIHHAHLEEDAGKLTHQATHSNVDLNRAGTPLIEIVSEPDIHSPAEARAYAEELHKLMTYAEVTLGNLYHGNMRFDVNLSVAPKGSDKLGTRAEVKNLNSFRSVERAAEYEFKRQVAVLESGAEVVQETRGWSDDTGETTSQRSKEDAQDYRYMPDPDIPPVVLTDAEIEQMQASVGRMPAEYRQVFGQLNVDSSVINSVLANKAYAEMVYQVLESSPAAARRVANWVASKLATAEAEEATDGLVAVAQVKDLVELSDMTDKAEISSNSAAELFNELMTGASDPRAIAEAKGLLQVSDEAAIAAIVDQVLADPASQRSIEDIKAGKDKAIGYLVGQVMKMSKGKANPGMAQKLIKQRL